MYWSFTHSTKKLIFTVTFAEESCQWAKMELIFKSLVIEALDWKGILNTLKKVLRQPWNALMLQLSLSLRDKQDWVYFR